MGGLIASFEGRGDRVNHRGVWVQATKGDVMKRVLIALMLAVFVGGALGCKGKDDKKDDKKEGDKAKTEKTEKKTE